MKKKIKDIKYLINEHYSDKEPLNESQKKSKECFNRYCDDIAKELEALAIMKKAFAVYFEIYRDVDTFNHFCVQDKNKLSKEEFELLKETLNNDLIYNYEHFGKRTI